MKRRDFIRLLVIGAGATVGVKTSNLLWQTRLKQEQEKARTTNTIPPNNLSMDTECCTWLVTPVGVDPNDDHPKNTITPDPQIINEFLFFDPTNKNLTIDCSTPEWHEKRFSDFKLTFHQQIFVRYTVKVSQKDDDILLQFYNKADDSPLYSTITLKGQATGNRIKEIAVIGDSGSKDLFVTEKLISPLRSARDWQTYFLDPLGPVLKDLSPSKMPPFDNKHSELQTTRKTLAEAITNQRMQYLIKTEREKERGQNIIAPKQGLER